MYINAKINLGFHLLGRIEEGGGLNIYSSLDEILTIKFNRHAFKINFQVMHLHV